MEGSIIGAKGVKALSEALKSGEFKNLASLHLKWNKIGNKGVKALSEALGKLPSLTSLDLSCNLIGDKGAKVLSEALKSGKLSNLTELSLFDNSIGDEGAKVLSEASRSGKIPNLTSRDLIWNKKVVTKPFIGTLKKRFSSEPEVSTASSNKSLMQCSKKFKSDEASRQQGTQFDQQQKTNAQVTSTQQQAQVTEESEVSTASSNKSLMQHFKKGVLAKLGTLKRRFSSEPEVSTSMQYFKKFRSNEASQQQVDQRQKPNAQATNDSNVPLMSRSRSSSLSSPDGSNSDQPGPSSRISEVQPMLRSQSLSSLHSSDSDISKF